MNRHRTSSRALIALILIMLVGCEVGLSGVMVRELGQDAPGGQSLL